jgi:hypothetical protein
MALICLCERDLMIRTSLGLLFVIFLLGAKPISLSEVSNRLDADPLQGWWIIESMQTWDANGKLTANSGPMGNYAFFSSQKWTIYHLHKMEKREEVDYRMVHSRNEYLGGIDFPDGGGNVTMEALFLLKGDKLSLCLKLGRGDTSRPNTCGPGKNHQLIEFIRYQPNHLVQTSKIPPSK